MEISVLRDILEAEVLCGEDRLEEEIETIFASDMMSDVLACSDELHCLLTNLINQQVIRTSDMLDIGVVIFVHGKTPPADGSMKPASGESGKGDVTMETVKLTYEIDGENFSAAGEASTASKRVLKKLKLPSVLVRRAVVCMYEGEINMVIHADGGQATLEVDEEKIVITLADRGPGIPDLDKAMMEGWSTASAEARNSGFGAGMGLPNMKRNSDEMDIQTEVGVGTTVTMTLYIGGESQ